MTTQITLDTVWSFVFLFPNRLSCPNFQDYTTKKVGATAPTPFSLVSLPHPFLKPQDRRRKKKKKKNCRARSHMFFVATLKSPREISPNPPLRHLCAPSHAPLFYFSCHTFGSWLWVCPPHWAVNVAKKGTMPHGQTHSLASGWRDIKLRWTAFKATLHILEWRPPLKSLQRP